MKKIVCFLLTALMLFGALSLAAFADEPTVYISYNNGNNANDGLSAASAKKSLGSASADGAISAVKSGGTVVISEKLYMGGEYTLRAFGPITFTANDGTKDYKNTEPANNPGAGVMKFKGGLSMAIESDLTLDDLILFQEAAQNTFIVKDGATLTVTDKIVCMSKQAFYTKIEVEEGGTAIINGGIFSSITGDGTIKIADGVKVLDDGADVADVPAGPADGAQNVCFIDYNGGSDSNSGASASQAVKGYKNGCIPHLTNGGTLVVSGKSYIAGNPDTDNTYRLPQMPAPLTITSVYGGKDYKNPEPATNPTCAFKFAGGTIFEISSDVIFDDIILFQESEKQNTIVVNPGATLVVTDKVVLMSKTGSHFKIVVEDGATAILSETAQATFDIECNGTVETYASSEPTAPTAPEKTVVKLTIGSATGYINDEAKALDAAPIIRNSRTMLPVRFLAEAFGAQVGWDGATSTATITATGVDVRITIGANEALINGVSTPLDSPAFIENGRTYLPVRVIADALGAAVEWDGATSTATLTK